MRLTRRAVLASAIATPVRAHAIADPDIATIVTQAIRPVVDRYGIPGMAVGVIVKGQSHVYDYGVASKATGRPVTADTLFEIGSVSKTFTATLTAYAQVTGKLALSDTPGRYLPSLRDSGIDKVTLLNLGTHTPGGFPLQFPDEITDDAQATAYFQGWKPTYAPGTYRTYANPSVGLLGVVAARSLGKDFVTLMEGMLLPGLGLKHTYLQIPEAAMRNYAQGYTKAGAPIRMAPGALAAETYGIRATAGDILRFVAANMGMLDLDPAVRRAITDTHTGYYQAGPMTQDLIWEQYDYPVALKDLLEGNAGRIASEATPVTALRPARPPAEAVWINKTGSTNGFAAYVAFVPKEQLGIVLLANRNYPIDARVTAAYEIMTRLGDGR
ncbi:class C beta-lactamase [Acidisphaera sp. S103]|uniref:class C beta-lactamase n=1 Tax=Acidisphaera sp. S103 TaxID=1747223 RepID=UPI001C202704|nr:class C beta-lactamase [Acidisphaera sp. S103]